MRLDGICVGATCDLSNETMRKLRAAPVSGWDYGAGIFESSSPISCNSDASPQDECVFWNRSLSGV